MATPSSTASAPSMKPTLGLTGLTVNSMALIAPGAFLWLTFAEQSLYGAPMAGCAMWLGILVALALCFATAISYAELSKLYPGAGSSYLFAEQTFLAKHERAPYARLARFIIGWASHIYYWVYPGVMVGVTAILAGYIAGQLWPSVFNAAVPSPLFMILFCIAFSFGVSYIAYRGVTAATNVNLGINVIQITALLIFSCIAIAYRLQHPEGSVGFTLNPDGVAINKVIAMDNDNKPVKDKDGNYVYEMVDGKPKDFTLSYTSPIDKGSDPKNPVDTFQYHDSALSVISAHGLSFVLVQACIAILLLVGFETVTALGEEAKDPKRHIARAVLISLVIQGLICYMFEYFSANYFLNSGYPMTTAAGSPAPIGDMMVLVGTWMFGSYSAGWTFMLAEAFTVFLALIGTTLACLTIGSRITYAMGRNDDVTSHFGILHGQNLTPFRAIWTLAAISAGIGIFAVVFYFCGGAALTDDTIKGLPQNLFYSFGIISHDTAAAIPQGLLVVTLISNFGTFMLYGLTCVCAMLAYRERHEFNGFKHMAVPLFGAAANVLCLLFYLIGPFTVSGMSWKEPYLALAVSGIWGAYGVWYFVRSVKSRPALLVSKTS